VVIFTTVGGGLCQGGDGCFAGSLVGVGGFFELSSWGNGRRLWIKTENVDGTRGKPGSARAGERWAAKPRTSCRTSKDVGGRIAPESELDVFWSSRKERRRGRRKDRNRERDGDRCETGVSRGGGTGGTGEGGGAGS